MSFSLAGILTRWAAETPDGPALTLDDTTLTWQQLLQRSQSVAGALAAEGVGFGDRVALLDKNGLTYFEVLFGAAMLGAVDVAVNWRLAPPEMAFIINDSGATVLVVHSDFAPVLAAFAGDLTTVKRIVFVGTPDGTHLPYEGWLSSATPVTEPVAVTDSDIALQLYTSGTTGLPKGAMLDNGNFSGLLDMAGQLEMGADAVNLAAMPMFHIGGSGWALFGMSLGVHTVLLRELVPSALLALIPEHRITHAFLVPAALLFLTLTPGVEEMDFSSLQALAYGASPISEDLLQRCQDVFGCGFYQVYGLTETTGAITLLTPLDHADTAHRERLRSAGRPMNGVEIRCVDLVSGDDVPDGEVGEVWIRTRQNMAGYWGQPEASAAVFEGDWFRTGDAGYLVDGYLFLHDRVKDMVVTGGENVYPAEVENALTKHPAVADAAVIGVPSDKWGEDVKAFVVPAPGATVDSEELVAFVRQHLAGFKVPRTVEVIDVLPRNPSGKVLKKELRAPYWEGRDRAI